ncbi:MAG: hypothetical protein JW809_03860 [Pirellulales bacterium]|nr:hypothetical protein [Pirellulales bacterium]
MEPVARRNTFWGPMGLVLTLILLLGCSPRSDGPREKPREPAHDNAASAAGQPDRPDQPAEPSEPTPDEAAPSSDPDATHKESTPDAAKETPPEPTEKTTQEEAAKDTSTAPSEIEPKSPPSDQAKPPLEAGPPLVDHAERLRKLDPLRPIWLDPEGKRVVMLGEVCQTNAPLEMFACLRGTKEHEAVVSIPTRARTVHAALLAVGAKVGQPVAFHPEYVPASGTEIDVIVHWKDAEGKVQSAKAQDWVRDIRSKQAMTYPWVFAGSGFWKDEETGTEHYQAESGDFICVSNFPSAMLDLPVPSTDKDNALLFEAFTERIPPLGTPVTVVLTPKLDAALKSVEPPASFEPPAVSKSVEPPAASEPPKDAKPWADPDES